MPSAAQVADEYGKWLDRQALAARTRSAYRRWVTELLERLDAEDELDAFLAAAGHDDRRAVLTDWRRRLVDRQLAPPTVNLCSGRRHVAVGLAGTAHASGPPRRARPQGGASTVARAAACAAARDRSPA